MHSYALALFCLIMAAANAGTAAAAGPVDYERDIKPLLAGRCYACHGALKQESGLRLDTVTWMRKGGENGHAVVPGDVEQSWLIQVVTGEAGFRMPPEDEGQPLTGPEIALLKRWIETGAEAPDDEKPQEDPRDHWSYQTPRRSAIPALDDDHWVRNPIDTFIAAKHEELGITPQPPAKRHVLLRRVYLDLIGLPPTRAELHAFLRDDSPNAYERVVDRLLNSARYGERWGRHWMDVWRYSDWYGRRAQNEIRYSQRHIWRWRDWIVESLNEDKGYDQMIIEMIAGDEVAPTDPKVLRATGFLGRNWYKFNRDVWMFETIEQTCRGILALKMRCARCHDHKYDPVSQEEYYRFRAFFEPHGLRTDRVSVATKTQVDNGKSQVLSDGLSRVYDATPTAPTYRFVRGDDRRPDKDHPLDPAVPAAFGNLEIQISPQRLPVESYYPGLRSTLVEQWLSSSDEESRQAQRALVMARQDLDRAGRHLERFASGPLVAGPEREEAQRQHSATQQLVKLAEIRHQVAQANRTAIQARISADRAKLAAAAEFDELARAAAGAERAANLAQAQAAVLEAEQALAAAQAQQQPEPSAGQTKAVADAEKQLATARKSLQSAEQAAAKDSHEYTPLGPEYPKTSTGRRLALARWMTDDRNPRTARVCVNHIWLRHFGEAIVSTVDNFGPSGRQPSHPRLLDWLAVELVQGGWSMKRLHRLIVTSSTYRMSSRSTGQLANSASEIDTDNVYLWRTNSRRMEAEAVRDSLLAVADQLDTTMGGPELDAKLGLTSRRRSLYFRVTPDDKMELLELFDLANPNECYRRRRSIVPQQSLALTNSGLALDQARLLARELLRDGDQVAFIRAGFEQVLGRAPTAAEMTACRKFMANHEALLENQATLTTFPPAKVDGQVAPARDPALRARENLLHVLINHNDFVTIR